MWRIYDNHRGSSSYGERFAMLLHGKYSSPEDYADHDSGVNAMIDLGFVDKDNLFIAGGSAGGIAPAYAVGLDYNVTKQQQWSNLLSTG